MKKVFVTGANGMLGSMVCRRLLESKYNVTAMCLPSSKVSTLLDLGINIVKGDILNKEMLLHAVDGHDYLIHTAALMKIWPRRNENLKKVNIDGTINVKEVCDEVGIQRLIHVGSASSFTEGTKENPGNEKSSFSWYKYGMDYIDSKFTAQEYLLDAYKTENFPVIVINPTFMVGPFDSGPTSGAMLISLYNGKIAGYTNGGKNFVFSGDVAQAIVNGLTLGRLGECYIAGNENLKFREFFQKASSVMNKKFTLKEIPQILILSLGGLNSLIARVVGKPPRLSYGMATMASINQYFSSEKAVTELRMPQTPIEQAVKESINWFKANNYIQ